MKSINRNQKLLLAGAVVAAIIVIAVINFMISNKSKTANTNDAFYEAPESLEMSQNDTAGEFQEDYFAVFREDRDEVRAREIEYLDTIVTGEQSDDQTIKAAQEQKLALINAMEKEVVMEGLLKGKGFSNAAVTLSDTSVNIVIDKGQLTDAEVAQVLDIATAETGQKASNIKIMPLNNKY